MKTRKMSFCRHLVEDYEHWTAHNAVNYADVIPDPLFKVFIRSSILAQIWNMNFKKNT